MVAIADQSIRRDGSSLLGRHEPHASMAAEIARRVTGRPVIGPLAGVPRAGIARQLGIGRDSGIARRREIAHRAETGRDSGIARAIPLAATGGALRRLDRRRARLGQVANSARAAAATINGAVRVGQGRCAGVADGTSRWWLNPASLPAPRLRRQRPKPRLLSSRPRARINSPPGLAVARGQPRWRR